jgi:hypothetical protein
VAFIKTNDSTNEIPALNIAVDNGIYFHILLSLETDAVSRTFDSVGIAVFR